MNSAAEAVQLLIDAWKLMVSRFPTGTIEHADGVVSTFGHVPLFFFNVSVPDRPTASVPELEHFLSTAQQRAKACAHPTMSIVCEEWMPSEWVATAAAHGLSPVMTLTGMDSIELLPPRRPLAAIEIERVRTVAAASDLATVNGLAYGMPAEMFDCICNLNLWHEDSLGFVGYVDGKAVSASAAFPVNGTIYIALVATHPDAQKHGYAEAVLRHTIDEAQKLMRPSARVTLHASDMGMPLYAAMGFKAGAKLQILAAGH